ncbi:MAG: glycosyltransferase 87 family protein [Jatrophihabitantaceae bacterium]
MTGLRLRTALAMTLGVEGLVVAVFVQRTDIAHQGLWLFCLALPVFALAVWLLAGCRLPRHQGTLIILGASAVLQLLAVTRAPITSDDDYRYVWDAKVQLAGIDPYRYPPDAPQLLPLRDEFLFPRTRCPHVIADGCTSINRPTVHTIYPPVAEAAFVAIRVASFGGHGGHLPIQLAGALGVIAVAWLLARRAAARDRPVWTVALWAWCPLPILEYSNAGHIDWLAVVLIVLAVSFAAARRSGLAGLLVGAAIATKLYPAIVLPALLRRRPGLVLGAASALVAMSYLPHVLVVGRAVLGYLPGYLREEKYASGERLLLLGSVLPHPLDALIGLLLLGLAAWVVWRRADSDAPEDGAVLMMGTALLVSTTVYGWYAGLLLALVVMSGALEWLPTALAPTLVYLVRLDFGASPNISRAIYAVAAALALLGGLLRRRRLHLGTSGSRPRPTVREE